jgi:hypothetical protein
MRIKFNRAAVLYGVAIGFIVTLVSIALISLFTSPEQLIFIYPSSIIWIVLLVMAAKWARRGEG